MPSDRDLQRRLAARVSTDELRRFVESELPEVHPSLPGGICSPAQLVHDLFRVADNLGCSAELRALLRREWPGLFGDVLPRPAESPPSQSVSRAVLCGLLALTQPQLSDAAAPPEPSVAASPDAPHAPGESCESPETDEDDAVVTCEPPPKAPPEDRSLVRIPPPRPLTGLRGELERKLRDCGSRFEGLDVEINLAADERGVLTDLDASYLSLETSRCILPVLERVRRLARGRRYHPGTARLTLWLPP